ncbi:MAG: hypothetical protein MJZ32_09280 [Bacteroidaceae bacterium]|nr:hypothetical protein [Bacteroidaceae bacterium]
MKKQYIQPSVKNHKLFFESALAAGSPGSVETEDFDKDNPNPDNDGIDTNLGGGDGSDF